MNAARRKRIADVGSKIADLREMIEEIKAEEEEAFDNLPESIQSGERGDKMQDAISALDDIIMDLDGAEDNCDTAAE